MTLLPFAPTLIPHDSPHPLAAGQGVVVWRRLPLQAIVSLPGSRRSLKVCMLMTSSVFTRAGGGGLCLSRRWHLRETLSSSTTALQKDLCGEKKTRWVPGPRTPARQQQLQPGSAWRVCCPRRAREVHATRPAGRSGCVQNLVLKHTRPHSCCARPASVS